MNTTSGIHLLGTYDDSSSEDESETTACTDQTAAVVLKTNTKPGGVSDKLSEFMAEIASLEPESKNCNSEELSSSYIQTTVHSINPNATTLTNSTSNASLTSNECNADSVSDWQVCFDESSQSHYYWNTKTNDVTWVPPPGWGESNITDDKPSNAVVSSDVAEVCSDTYGPQLPEKKDSHTDDGSIDSVRAALFKSKSNYKKTTVNDLRQQVRRAAAPDVGLRGTVSGARTGLGFDAGSPAAVQDNAGSGSECDGSGQNIYTRLGWRQGEMQLPLAAVAPALATESEGLPETLPAAAVGDIVDTASVSNSTLVPYDGDVSVCTDDEEGAENTSTQVPKRKITDDNDVEGRVNKKAKVNADSDDVSSPSAIPVAGLVDMEGDMMVQETKDVEGDTLVKSEEILKQVKLLLTSNDVDESLLEELQVLLIQLQTRITDYKCGALDEKYFLHKLMETKQELMDQSARHVSSSGGGEARWRRP